MLDHYNLTREQRDLLYSLPFVPDTTGYIIDDDFFRYCERYYADNEIYERVFFLTGFGTGPEASWDLIWEWVDFMWPVWRTYCEKYGKEPGIKPVRESDVTDVDDIVF